MEDWIKLDEAVCGKVTPADLMNAQVNACIFDVLNGDKVRRWMKESVDLVYTSRLIKVGIDETGGGTLRLSVYGKFGA